VITGAESTGKTELAGGLAGATGGSWIPEYARSYIGNLDRPYRYTDVEHIAARQLEQLNESLRHRPSWLFVDTYLVITRVWFREVFGKEPGWLENALRKMPVDLFLACETDLPWEPDPLRENPGTRREYLSDAYKTEIEALGYPWFPVTGTGMQRLKNALEILGRFYNEIPVSTYDKKQ